MAAEGATAEATAKAEAAAEATEAAEAEVEAAEATAEVLEAQLLAADASPVPIASNQPQRVTVPCYTTGDGSAPRLN